MSVTRSIPTWTKNPPTGVCWARVASRGGAVVGCCVCVHDPAEPRWVYFGEWGASLPDLVENFGYEFAPIGDFHE